MREKKQLNRLPEGTTLICAYLTKHTLKCLRWAPFVIEDLSFLQSKIQPDERRYHLAALLKLLLQVRSKCLSDHAFYFRK